MSVGEQQVLSLYRVVQGSSFNRSQAHSFGCTALPADATPVRVLRAGFGTGL